MSGNGYLAIVLHAHLPFVRHPEHEDFLEEDWLYQAVAESYLPLLEVFERLVDQRVPFRLTFSLSPTLSAMLGDPLLMRRCGRRLELLCELADREVHRTRSDPRFHPVALDYRARYGRARQAFAVRYRGDLLAAFRALADQGSLELITTGATHGFLPLLHPAPGAVRGQVVVGLESHRRAMGREPAGFWLPECGYAPGVEGLLAQGEVRYFLVDTHGLTHASPPPPQAPYVPVFTRAGVAAFARDPESSRQVWSRESGYPGDPRYREYYRDIGWDLDAEYLRPYLQPDGGRKGLGFKYYRITGGDREKEPYEPERALRRARRHARHFQLSRQRQLRALAAQGFDRTPLAVAPYDAELFGHWWSEGPAFLEALIRRSARPDAGYALITPWDYLRKHCENPLVELSMSSWGEGGYARMWLDPPNDWIYPRLHRASERMAALLDRFEQPGASPWEERALAQAARELLLAQSSDWPFLIRTGTAPHYAAARISEHLARFDRLESGLREGNLDRDDLARIEQQDNLFPWVDPRVYRAAQGTKGPQIG